MGLFKKRADPAEVDRLRAEIEAMSARLAAADATREQLDELDGKVAGLTSRLDTPIAPPIEPPPPPPGAVDPREIDKLNAKIERIHVRLDETPLLPVAPPGVDPAELAEVRSAVERLTERLDDAPPTTEPTPGVDPAELAEVRSAVERLTERLDEVDGRITSISVELANQISELSGDIESLGGHEPPTDEVVDELRDAQTRLANEQARYQIAFRQDLADLADRLRRS